MVEMLAVTFRSTFLGEHFSGLECAREIISIKLGPLKCEFVVKKCKHYGNNFILGLPEISNSP